MIEFTSNLSYFVSYLEVLSHSEHFWCSMVQFNSTDCIYFATFYFNQWQDFFISIFPLVHTFLCRLHRLLALLTVSKTKKKGHKYQHIAVSRNTVVSNDVSLSKLCVG